MVGIIGNCIILISQMYDLYKDPRGEGIFGKRGNTNTTGGTTGTNGNTTHTFLNSNSYNVNNNITTAVELNNNHH